MRRRQRASGADGSRLQRPGLTSACFGSHAPSGPVELRATEDGLPKMGAKKGGPPEPSTAEVGIVELGTDKGDLSEGDTA